MKIMQFSTSSSSNEETPATTVPPRTVDPAFQERVGDFLGNTPTGTDAASTYIALKKHMGIVLSTNPTPFPTSQNPLPSPSTTRVPSPSPTLNPLFPLVQYNDDEDDEEAAEPEPFVRNSPGASPRQEEAAPTVNIPSPMSGGNSASVHGPQSTEVVNIDDDEEEDLPPPPSDMPLQR